jgi:hypothetical protein
MAKITQFIARTKGLEPLVLPWIVNFPYDAVD